jgi:DNA polymerase-3 subunit gamma/tau
MGKALYRKYRSKSLGEVIGQKHVTDILAAALAQGRVSHAYLFTGPRGVGKTSVARILAHEINGLPYTEEDSHLDIIEIDAASNNGVDDIRNLREKVMITPTSAPKKVYIIDEVHMLSKPAFNALLKTLEEPPEHVVFIMATTDTHKIPATIVSRSQQFAFRFIQPEDVVQHLRHIANSENVKITDDALALIAKKGGGSFRDSIGLLDQISSVLDDREISKSDIEEALGLAPEELILDLLGSYAAGDSPASLQTLQKLLETGTKPELLAEQLMKQIIADIDNQLGLIELLHHLPDVAKSSYPEVKLLTVLVGSVSSLNVPTNPKQPQIRPSGVAKQTGKPSVNSGTRSAANPADLTDHSGQVFAVPKSTEKIPATLTPSEVPEVSADSGQSAFPASSLSEAKERGDENVRLGGQSGTGEGAVLDWDALLEDMKTNRPAIYSVLSKCGHTIEDGELRVYAKNKLWQKKLDTAVFRQRVAENGGADLDVLILAATTPSGSGAVNAIADIMGGGEEVEIDAN